MTILDIDQLLAGIRQVESGGNYRVVNSIGAVGAYQVMKSNIPEWTREALGYSMTWQQFRDSPAAQDAVARYKLGHYMNKYGSAEAAASMWFSGQPNWSSSASDGYNTTYQYVQKVMGAAGSSVGASTIPTGSTYQVAAVTPKLSMEDMAARFGLSVAVLQQNKQIRDLVSKAVSQGWDQSLFTAYLKNTQWWRTTTDAQRKFFFLRAEDPATYQQKWSQYQSSVNQMAVQVGLPNQINKRGQSSGLLQKAILFQMRDGWTDARLKAWLGSQVTLHNGQMWGEAGQAYDQLFQLAYDNGVVWSPSWFQKKVQNIMAQRQTLESVQGELRNAAAAKYSSFANQIKAGQNVIDLASPYIQSVSQILELPSTSVDLSNKWVNKAMTAKQAPGMQPGQQYPLWQFENDLRSDPLWKQTNNARESMFSVAHQVARDFGLAF